MSAAKRQSQLLELLQRPGVVLTASQLATVFGITVNTVYRDIEKLRSQGHRIETTVHGFHLRPEPAQTPAIFTKQELEAIAMGLLWLSGQEESPLAGFADTAIAKIEAMLPPPPQSRSQPSIDETAAPLDIIRAAIFAELKLHLDYRDAKGRPTSRIIWPIELDAYDETGMVAAWCEHRSDFRNFRLDRIQSIHLLDRYPVRRQTLLARFQLQQDEDPWY